MRREGWGLRGEGRRGRDEGWKLHKGDARRQQIANPTPNGGRGWQRTPRHPSPEFPTRSHQRAYKETSPTTPVDHPQGGKRPTQARKLVLITPVCKADRAESPAGGFGLQTAKYMWAAKSIAITNHTDFLKYERKVVPSLQRLGTTGSTGLNDSTPSPEAIGIDI